MNIIMLLYPRLTQLDLTGPFEVFARLPDVTIILAAKSLDPVTDSGGLRLLPTHTLTNAPQADILFVPGGPGQLDLMDDTEVLDFLRAQAAGAGYVTSVCTGSLVLAAAGLLKGYRATCHWMSLEQLALFGCTPCDDRVVVDRNRVTGGGVTSGIDFALHLAALLFNQERAERIQLSMEYDPAPPFSSGHPNSADPAIVEAMRARASGLQEKRWAAARAAAARLGKG
ncbi:DJ-1/PfpI family protein [Niveispirillum cyanobacteriorum]|uniref:Thiamine biosynthesis protein ThiJ n=1 Tax=Niveispirillum cyanobacteriorum TaxID=1612173 RepID=A0A2K9NF57_9PROT|nr:DJ-1/PfpI family protein [Niveispirillum cyanobacteriorum]AUN30865.1 thiamine biosynthesis protein ThiJ [Niveispirillum cyanobacteriorum]GGE80283.1 dimethylglycine dehydrogenase [Niveispirillum cyanobacteriorum]